MGREKRPNLVVLLTRRCGGSARQMSRKRARFARPLSGQFCDIGAPRDARGTDGSSAALALRRPVRAAVAPAHQRAPPPRPTRNPHHHSPPPPPPPLVNPT